MIWAEDTNDSLRGQFITPAGAIDPSSFEISSSTVDPAGIAFGGGNYLVVYGDDSITPQDALMAFQHYLEIFILDTCQQDRANVNGDETITPADALCIFKRYLELPSCLDQFYNDTDPPTLVSKSPDSNEYGVAVGTVITITFSEEMDQASLMDGYDTCSGNFRLTVTGNGSPCIAGSFSFSGSTMSFTPTADLDYSTFYHVDVLNTATDLSGNPLTATSGWGFSTPRGQPKSENHWRHRDRLGRLRIDLAE